MSFTPESGSRTADLGTTSHETTDPRNVAESHSGASSSVTAAATQPITAEATQPIHRSHVGEEITPVKIGAAALTAVTAAAASSFLGPLGTTIGAAAGAVISTVATSFYTRSLHRAGDRLQKTGAVVVQRMPRGANQHPADIAGTTVATVALPAEEPATAAIRPPETVALSADPATTALGADTATTALPAGDDAGDDKPAPRWGRRLALAGGGFVIALGAITGIEALIGHPLSGGSGGSTIGDVTGSTTTKHSTTRPTPAGTDTSTSTATSTTEPSTSPTSTPTASSSATDTSSPTATDSVQPTTAPTGGSSASASASAGAAAGGSGGADGGGGQAVGAPSSTP